MADQTQKPGGVINPTDTKPPVVDAAADAAKAAADAAKPPVVVPDADPSKAADAAKPGDKAAEGSAKSPDSKDPAQKPTDSKPAGAPESYDLKVPENSFLSADHLDSLKTYAKEKGLSNDDAQALLQREHDAAQATIDVVQKRSEIQSQAWLAEAKADKEIGGDNFPKTVELANHALNSLFPGVEIRKFMDATGFGNNPVVLRGFAKIGKMLKPDAIVQPGGQPPPKKDPVKTMYDHPTSQQSKT